MKTFLRPPDLWLAFQRTKGSRMADEYTLQGDLSLQRMKQTEHRSVPRWEQMECEFLLRVRRENEKWDNSSQLIHCTLKTHYFLRRKQKTCSPRWKEILCWRWRPWHSLPDFPHVCSFFYVRFSRFDSFLLTGSFVPAWQWAPAAPRTPTNLTAKCLNTWWTHCYGTCQKHKTGSFVSTNNKYFTCVDFAMSY